MSTDLNTQVKSIPLTETLFSFCSTRNKSNIYSSFPNPIDNDDKKNIDVNIISTMHKGSLMIISPNPNELDNKMDYQFYFLSKDNQNVHVGSSKNKLFSVKDIINVSMLNDEILHQFENILNKKGISIIGLRSLMFFIDIQENNGKKYRSYVIGESDRASQIWFQGLQYLYHNNLSSTVTTSLPLTISNRIRIGHKNLYQTIKNIFTKSNENLQSHEIDNNNNNENSDSNTDTNTNSNSNYNDNDDDNKYQQKIHLINSIEKDSDSISKHINDLYSFASRACILDSTEHLTLLSQAMNLKKIYDEIQCLISQIHENNDNILSKDIDHLEELYYHLHSELTAVALKSYNMKKDMGLARQ